MVMHAIVAALHTLGSKLVVDLQKGRARALAGGELWLVGSGSGNVALSNGRVTTMKDGVARVETERAGAVAVTRAEGDARPRLAFSRPIP
jgi:hypothetical protein